MGEVTWGHLGEDGERWKKSPVSHLITGEHQWAHLVKMAWWSVKPLKFDWIMVFFRDSGTYCLGIVFYSHLKLSQLIWPAARGRRNDEMIRLGVWHIPYSFRDVEGLLLASAQNTKYKAPSSSIPHVIDRLLNFCWWKSMLEILGFQTRGLYPRPSAQQAIILPLDHSAALMMKGIC